MKRRILMVVALMLVVVMSLSSCEIFNIIEDFFMDRFAPDRQLQAAPLTGDRLVDFRDGKPSADVLFESDGWTNGDVFNVVWKSHNVIYENETMRLGITEEKATAWLGEEEVEFNYTAGEARTTNYYHYGDYEVCMKPSANPGTASTFFVCTGPYDLKGDVPNPHDEIDIEFLGNDTTHVQFNFFVNGKGGNEFLYDLGFDASKELHRYGFRWEPNAITWFVDGEPVYRVTTDDVEEGRNLRHVDVLPSTAGRILTNYWCGNERAYGWMGQYKGEVNDNGTVYQWIKTSAEGAPLNPPVEPPVDGGDEINWAEVAPIAPAFPSAEKYVVTVDGNKANVTYTDVGGSEYKPIELDVTEAVAGKNYVNFKVTNNGTETVNLRVNMFDPTLTGNNQATNISATMNGQPVYTDLSWGGSFFDIPAGETVDIVVNFGVGGIKLQLMIDSSRNDSVLRSGDITVEDIKFAAVGEVETPCTHVDADEDGKCDECGNDMPTPPAPPAENPTSGNLTLNFGEFTTNIGGNVTDGYGVNVGEGNVIDVTYTNIVGDSYKNIWADVSAIAATKTTFTLKVKNYGEAPVKVRIDMESQTQTSPNTTCCNVSATQDGNGVYTDTTWGGSMFEIAAGATATLEVVYNPANKPTNVKIMIDSHTYQDSNVYAGHVEISELSFSGEYVPEEGGDDPIDPPAPSIEYTDLYVEFKTENAYTLTTPDTYANQVRVTYTDITNSWENINIGVADKSADCSVFSMKLTNHGTAQVSVWVQMKDAAGTELINQNVNIAAGAEEVFTFNYTGTAEMIFFFVDSTHEAASGSKDGDITISELKLGKVAQTEEPEEGGDDPQPVVGEYLSFTANDCYTLSATADQYVNELTVSYTEVYRDTYLNVNTYILDKAAGKSTMGITLKNEGEKTVTITVKLEGATSSEVKLEKTVEIASGETLTLSEAYSDGAQMLYLFIDSGWSNNTITDPHASTVVISGINFQ